MTLRISCTISRVTAGGATSWTGSGVGAIRLPVGWTDSIRGRTARRRPSSQLPSAPASSAATSPAAQGHQRGSQGCEALSIAGLCTFAGGTTGPGTKPGSAVRASSVGVAGSVGCVERDAGGAASGWLGGVAAASLGPVDADADAGVGEGVGEAATLGAAEGPDVGRAVGVGLGDGIARGPIGTPARISAGPWTDGVGVAPGGRLKSCGRSCAASGPETSTAAAKAGKARRRVVIGLKV